MASRWRNFYTFRGISPFDLVLALGVAYLYFGNFYFHNLPFHQLSFSHDSILPFPERTLTVVAIIAGMLYSIPTAFRRTRPELSAALVFLGALLRILVAPWETIPPDFIILFALYAVTAYGAPWAHRTALASAFIGAFFVSRIYGTFDFAWRFGFPDTYWNDVIANFTLSMLVVVIVYTVALLRRNQIQRVTQMIEEAEVARARAEQEAELAVLEERSRIAREMHDVVAHTLSVVIAQADGGQYAAAKNPEAAIKALETIAGMGRGALKDIRSIIGVLRSSEPEQLPLLPQPVAEDLDSLIQQVRDSGTNISLTRLGTPRHLPTGVGTAIYRICQEAITNTLKHAGSDAHISVIVQWLESEIVLQVDDDGVGPGSHDGKGHGIIGMNERASAFGGSVYTGAIQGGGFRVIASIPLEESSLQGMWHDH